MMRGIRGRLVAFAFLLVLLVGGAISLGTLLHARYWIRDNYEEECRGVAALLAEQVADPLYGLDVSAVRSILRHAHVNRSLLHVLATDAAGAVLAGDGSENELRDSRPTDPFSLRAVGDDAWISREEGKVLRIGGPIRMVDGARVGTLLATFSLEPAQILFRQVLRGRVLISLQCLGLGALLAFLLANNFTRPIRELVATTRAIEAGNFAARVRVDRRDELGLLAASVNRMAGSLERTSVSKAHLDRILESMSEPLLVLDAGGRMRTVNAAAERLLGYRRADLLGRSIDVVLEGSPWSREGAEAWTWKPPVRDVETNLLAVDGSPIPVTFSASLLGSEADAPGGIVCVARDVRETKRAQQALAASEERFRSIFEQTAVGVVLLSPEGRVLRANAAYAGLVGLDPEFLEGRHVDEWTHPEDRDETARLFEGGTAPPRRSIDVEKRFLRRDGSVVWARIASTAFCDLEGRPDYLVALVQDVTDRRRAKETLERARDEALGHARLKSEFLANVSHEIRTPMNGILGFVELLEGTGLDATQREHLATVRACAEGLLGVMNDLLDLSKIEAGKLELEAAEFDPLELLEEVADLLAPRADAKGLELVVGTLPALAPRLRGDRARLRQVLLNLAGNAVKFTERGEVVLLAEIGEGERPEVAIAVRDTGIGIPLERRGLLFAPFTQVDGSSTRRHGGSGLGLAISKGLVDRMGGRIEVESAAGVGSTFTVVLHLERASRPPVPAPEAQALRGRRVLLLVEHAPGREVIERLLRSFGCEPRACADLGEARARLEEARYEIALVDEDLLQAGGIAAALPGTAEEGVPRWIRIARRRSSGPSPRDGARSAGRVTKPVRRRALLGALLAACAPAAPGAGSRPLPLSPGREKARRRGIHVLLVEDEPVNQKVALGLLRRLGVEADLAASGREGVEAAARVRYDLVLMDVQMPDMDGFETTAAIRACEGAGPRVPIVAMTARAMKGDRERCLAAGMDDYLTKPVRGEDLDRALDRWGPRAGSGEGTAEGGAEGEPESGVRSPAADPGSPDPVARGPRAQ